MSRLDAEQLPKPLRELFLQYVAPLNRSIIVLLQTTTDEDFECSFRNVMNEYMRYYTAITTSLREEELGLLLKKSFSSPPVPTSVGLVDTHLAETEPQTLIEQTLNDALRVTARVTRLTLEDACQQHLLEHPDAWAPYQTLGAYTTILNYIFQAGIEPSVVEKVIQRCQKTIREVEDLIDGLNIRLDPELTAGLERLAAGQP